MDLATLVIFRTVARELSIARAAGQLGRVPSNVTTRVQQLEEELGVVLFECDKKRLSLTAQGKLFLDYADRLLNLADEAQQALKPGTTREGFSSYLYNCEVSLTAARISAYRAKSRSWT